MKKEVIVDKVLCDFCNKELTKENEFILPVLVQESSYILNSQNVKLMRYDNEVLTKHQVDLCDECQKKLVYLSQLIPHIENIDNGFTITYNTK